MSDVTLMCSAMIEIVLVNETFHVGRLKKSAFQLGKQGVENNTFLFPSSYPKVGFNRHQGAFNPAKKKMFRIVGEKKTEPIM